MAHRKWGRWFYPAAVWVIILAAVFASEYGVMVALPRILPLGSTRFVESIVDAVILTLVLAPILWFTIVRPLREVIRLRARFLTDLFGRMEAEKRKIAYDLHDGLGQTLTLLVSGLRSEEGAADRREELQRLAQSALAEVRTLALGLRPSLLDDLGLQPALERLVADVGEHAPFEVTLNAESLTGRRLPGDVETAAFRIVQEALNNVLKHAAAHRVSVDVRMQEGAIVVRVADDGRGIDPDRASAAGAGHFGLTSMQERASLLGGDLVIDSAPDRGTRVTATIPVQA